MDLPNRAAVESKFAANLARSFSDYRHKIEPFLRRGEPVPDAVYAEIEEDAQQRIAAILLILFLSSAETHGAPPGIIEPAASEFANSRGAQVAEQLVANTRARLSAPAMATATVSQRIEQSVMALGPERAATIAVTETTVATSAGGERGVASSVGLQEFDLWYTRQDDRVCPICGPLHAAKRSLWSLRFPNGPPGHPNCRCYIEYEFERN
jgi:hypothetical protein